MHRTTRNTIVIMKTKARKTMKNSEKYKTADERARNCRAVAAYKESEVK